MITVTQPPVGQFTLPERKWREAITSNLSSLVAWFLNLITSDWTPTFSCSGSMTYDTPTITQAKYLQIGKLCFITLRASATTGGTASAAILFTLPVAAARNAQMLSALVTDPDNTIALAYLNSTTQCTVKRYDSANYGLGASRAIWLTGVYETA